ncbi:hypothetical protein [Aquabacterium sp. CECT 9606]|uniref:hypothetical protein n=1 Tax=Aquabacterium sp. CECT 9606 TaxID=2845822 RepID=UPI001E325314|nr:hypothetical protein [Aquabacterium sp. CECT 9606]CAH0353477.1 hypothetical protein AQB9606_03263 [Aquabacterium sp. CECT 9606]
MDGRGNTNHDQVSSDAVLRKIGRNVVLFQQIEGLLKFLVANHKVDGSTSTLEERRQHRVEKAHKQTMGQLIEQFSDGILSDAGEPSPEPEDVTEVWMSFTFTTSGDSAFYETQRADMKRMVDERNDLIHHFLPRWEPESSERMVEAATYLDEQRARVLPIFEHLRTVCMSMRDARQSTAEFFASEEIQHQFELLLLQHSPLVLMLQEVAAQKSRGDGWAYIADAGRVAWLQETDAVTHMKERHGYATLKKLAAASGLFDLFDEPLAHGGFRTLYRARSSPALNPVDENP